MEWWSEGSTVSPMFQTRELSLVAGRAATRGGFRAGDKVSSCSVLYRRKAAPCLEPPTNYRTEPAHNELLVKLRHFVWASFYWAFQSKYSTDATGCPWTKPNTPFYTTSRQRCVFAAMHPCLLLVVSSVLKPIYRMEMSGGKGCPEIEYRSSVALWATGAIIRHMTRTIHVCEGHSTQQLQQVFNCKSTIIRHATFIIDVLPCAFIQAWT